MLFCYMPDGMITNQEDSLVPCRLQMMSCRILEVKPPVLQDMDRQLPLRVKLTCRLFPLVKDGETIRGSFTNTWCSAECFLAPDE
jgi:hypothetical protein